MSDSLQPHGLYSPWNSPGQNTGVGSLSLLQGIFPTQGLNLGLLHCRYIPYHLIHQGSPATLVTLSNNAARYTGSQEWRSGSMAWDVGAGNQVRAALTNWVLIYLNFISLRLVLLLFAFLFLTL